MIYRWELRADLEKSFQEAWKTVTESIALHRGGLGSRLHRTEDGVWLAYAQWPSKDAWEASRVLGAVDEEASEAMRAAIEKAYEPILLHPVADLLAH